MNADEAERNRFHKHVVHTIQEMVRAATDAVRCDQQIIAAYIDAVTATRPGLMRADIDYRGEQLAQPRGFRHNTFFQNILSDIMTIHGQGDTAEERPRADAMANACEREITRNYRHILSNAHQTIPTSSSIRSGMPNSMGQVALILADQLQTHFLRNTAKLVGEV
ncbi:hypothetical protein BC939DRAFT_444865 [Gamsiella multidivaricata]|uniref:uncharacterized protein n=1 Tax=Gamsiella multidivaricata TaxID=101098 RepID=UPI00222099CE|nr:uncharacterized protein BC939DRAFT_444865 [Gamsiella multidivaricata]KAI7827651.1 hypothetical protein BC939DRAFT_444865 [Gamsiella multidivaricata]